MRVSALDPEGWDVTEAIEVGAELAIADDPALGYLTAAQIEADGTRLAVTDPRFRGHAIGG